MLKVFDLAELTKHRSLLKRPWVWVAAAAMFLLVLFALAWVFRSTIASGILSQYCASRDLSCRADVSKLTFGRVEARSVEIGPARQAPSLVAGKINANLVWSGLNPAASEVVIDSIDVTLGFDGSELDLRGLDRLGGGGGGPAPVLSIVNGDLTIETPAGQIQGRFSGGGRLPDQFEAQLDLVPAQLSTSEGRVELESGRAILTNDAGSLSGEVELNLSRFETADTELENVLVRINRGDQDDLIAWLITAQRLDWQTRRIETLDASGFVSLASGGDNGLFGRVDRIEGAGTSGAVQSNAHLAKESAFIFSVASGNDAGANLTAEVALLGLDGEIIGAEDATLIYTGEINAVRRRVFGRGELIANGAALADRYAQDLFSGAADAGPLSAHLRQFERAYVGAASNFDTRLRFDADIDLDGQWQILIPSTVGLVSETGLIASLSPGLAGPVLSATSDGVTLSGVAAVSGGGLPALNADIRELSISDQGNSLRVGGLQLEPWRVSGTSVSARLNRAYLDWDMGEMSTSLIGELGLDGDVFGWRVANGRLFGSIDARTDAKGLRVQTLESDCLGLAFDAATGANTLTVGPLSTAICPQDGRLLEQTIGDSQGRLQMADIELPLSGANLTGTARMARTNLNWRAGDALILNLETPRAELDLKIAGRSLLVEANAPRLEVDLGRRTEIGALLGETVVTGDLIPASVKIPAVTFQGALLNGRFEADASAARTIIEDPRTDPLFQPILADVSAQFTNSDLIGTADLFSAANEFPIGEGDLELNLVSLDGVAQVRTGDLVFVPGGLQPTDLSERVRGLLTTASGGLTASADLNLNKGSLSGTGRVAVSELGFDTLRLGRVSDVDGSIVFNDLLGLTTPPAQTIKIGRIEPGIALENGEIQFQLRGNGEARLEAAIWPFAGGELVVQPVDWTIAGQRDQIMVSAEEIELAGLVEEFQLPDLEADGTVSGLLPISFESGNVLIEDALLTANERGGFLKYTGQSVSAVETQDVRVDSAFQALRDFRFSVLELGIDGNLIGDLLLRLKLLGYNPEVLGGAEFSFNISIDSRFIDLIQSGRRALGTEWLARATLGAAELDTTEPVE